MQRAYQAFKNQDVIVLTISIDVGGVPTVKPFLAEHGYTMPALVDSNLEVGRRFGLLGTPGTFIVNRQGMIVASGSGPVDFDHPEFRKYIENLESAKGH